MQNKLNKIIENFGANRYEFPESLEQYRSLLQEIESQLNETKNVPFPTR